MRQIDHVGGFGGDVACAPHGYNDAWRSQRRGVVNAVADHGDMAALRLELPYAIQLLFGEQLGFDVGNAGFSCNYFGGAATVAGEHDAVLDLEFVQPIG